MRKGQTTLAEFVDDVDDVESTDGPTPAENAADIRRLADLLQELTDQVGTLAGELEQTEEPTEYSADTSDTDPQGMFQ